MRLFLKTKTTTIKEKKRCKAKPVQKQTNSELDSSEESYRDFMVLAVVCHHLVAIA